MPKALGDIWIERFIKIANRPVCNLDGERVGEVRVAACLAARNITITLKGLADAEDYGRRARIVYALSRQAFGFRHIGVDVAH